MNSALRTKDLFPRRTVNTASFFNILAGFAADKV